MFLAIEVLCHEMSFALDRAGLVQCGCAWLHGDARGYYTENIQMREYCKMWGHSRKAPFLMAATKLFGVINFYPKGRAQDGRLTPPPGPATARGGRCRQSIHQEVAAVFVDTSKVITYAGPSLSGAVANTASGLVVDAATKHLLVWLPTASPRS